MIMNEKEKVENLIKLGGFSPSNNYYEVRLIVRYFITEKNMTIKEEIIQTVKDILKDKMDGYYEWEWEDKIEDYTKEELKNQTKLSDINVIYTTQEEIDIIRKLKTPYQRKLLFTLLMYARYVSIKMGEDKEWINRKQEEIFKSANLDNLSQADQDYIVADLIDLGLVSYDYKVDSLNLKLNCLHNDGDIVLWINSFEDLGNYIENYLKVTYGGYKVCEVCGKPYKPKAKDYSSKYCNSCKKIVIKERDRARKTKKE